MSKASIKALFKQIESGQIKTDAAKVLNHIIKNEGETMPFIQSATRVNSISSRLSGLEDEGIIYKTESDDKRFSRWYYVAEEAKRPFYAELVRKRNYKAWLKRGEKFGFKPNKALNPDELRVCKENLEDVIYRLEKMGFNNVPISDKTKAVLEVLNKMHLESVSISTEL